MLIFSVQVTQWIMALCHPACIMSHEDAFCIMIFKGSYYMYVYIYKNLLSGNLNGVTTKTIESKKTWSLSSGETQHGEVQFSYNFDVFWDYPCQHEARSIPNKMHVCNIWEWIFILLQFHVVSIASCVLHVFWMNCWPGRSRDLSILPFLFSQTVTLLALVLSTEPVCTSGSVLYAAGICSCRFVRNRFLVSLVHHHPRKTGMA